jgi:hypothetical protein
MRRSVSDGALAYYVPATSHYTVRVTRHQSGNVGEILEVCFGTVEISAVEYLGQERFGARESVTMVPHLLPWVKPFRRRLQLPDMPFQSDFIVANHSVVIELPTAEGFNWRKMFWPIGGRDWYPGIYPAPLRGARDQRPRV